MRKTFCLLATAVIAVSSTTLSLAQSLRTPTYDASVQEFTCNAGLGDSTAEWYATDPKKAPGEDLAFNGIIAGQNLNDNDLLRSRIANPRKVWLLRTTANGSVGSASNAGYRIIVTRITGRRGTNTNFRQIVVHFKAPPSVSRADLRITGFPQDRNQISRNVQFSNIGITGNPGEWQIATANYDDFGFPNNTFVRQFNVFQVNAPRTTTSVQFGRFNVRNTPLDLLENVSIYFDNLFCGAFSRN
ncbi:MAG: hypothetical protein JST89_04195 [Cyanobacteria bacterium SZAS-4]|nr:hypothetical protein [Cyanobacteria bacterium SZAS-4]